MTFRQFKTNIFVIEGFNAFATGLYFNWVFFYTKTLGFGVAENLGLVALHGLIYTPAAWFGGWFAHRFGNYPSLKIGFVLMAIALGAGSFLPFKSGQIAVMLLWTFGMCFTWPTLQSLVGDGEEVRGLPRMAGIYNVVWSAFSALSFFLGGVLFQYLGIKSLFWIPAVIHIGQLGLVFFLERKFKQLIPPVPPEKIAALPVSETLEEIAGRKKFLRYALMANPFAYVAINTAIPMIPQVAARFELSHALTGVFCSVWFFTRMSAFILFWLWPGWHYRFGILLAAKIALAGSFLGILLAPQLWILLVAQILFGLSIGLIYYSSLYYSMHGGAAKKQHGGAHEAMIGLGTLVGAGVGIGAKLFFPEVAGISVWAVSGLLFCGMLALIWLRYRKQKG